MTGQLTPHQQQAANAILQTLTTGGQCALAGYAGTGKSFTTGYIATRLCEAGYSVAAVTHAHKALAVLNANLPHQVTTMTMFSALGWRHSPRGTVKSGKHRLVGFAVLLVDEASMINSDMYHEVQRIRESLGFAVLWIGDPAQLPPVKEDCSIPPVFSLVQEQHHLSEIVRQGAGNPIIDASMYVRECLEAAKRPSVTEMLQRSNGGAIRHTGGGVRELVANVVSATEHGLDVRAVAYRNVTVDRINNMVAAHFHPPGSERLINGDQVTFGTTYQVSERHAITTDAGGKALLVGLPTVYGCLQIKCLPVKVEVEGKEVELMTPCDLTSYKAELKQRKAQLGRVQAAYRKSFDPAEMESLTEQIDSLLTVITQCEQEYADVRHVYASTAHKAQGSTYDVAVVDWTDLNKMPDDAMLARLLYVAMTRASKFLVIVE